ncbi:hypothetical protein [Marinobacter sp. P4B1]|uniref:hypothetical protein n=1 Tax=Marinobacter sp. P4B1 TaxID=1119533 RepID=UPI00071CB598|nr:hypothetical protein [Marinobacter sp. P4B1]KRW83649.1 hypothetical protein AQ621_16505 [Marinobacter sp. P4B1]
MKSNVKGWQAKRLLLAMGCSVGLAGCISDSSDEPAQNPGGEDIVIVVPPTSGGGDTSDPGLEVGEAVEQLVIYVDDSNEVGTDRICTASGADILVHDANGALIKTLRSDANGVVNLDDVVSGHYLTLTASRPVSAGASITQAFSIQRDLIDDSYEVTLLSYNGTKTNCADVEGDDSGWGSYYTLAVDGAEGIDAVVVKPDDAVFQTLGGGFGVVADGRSRDLLVMGYNFNSYGDMILERYSYEKGVQGQDGDEVRVSLDLLPESLIKPVESNLVDMESFWLHPQTWRNHSIEALSAASASVASSVKTVNVGEGGLQVRRKYESGESTMVSVENYPNFGFPVPEVTEEVGAILSPTLTGQAVYFDLVTPGYDIFEMSYERRNQGNLLPDGNDPVSHKVYTKDVDGEFVFPDLGTELESQSFDRLDMTLATGPNEDDALWVKSRYTGLIMIRPSDDALTRYLGDEVKTIQEAQRKIFEGYNANRVLHTYTSESVR